MIRLMSSAGKPTVSRTMTIVTKPADGMPAAPIEAAVAVTLFEYKTKTNWKTSRFSLESSYAPDGNQLSERYSFVA